MRLCWEIVFFLLRGYGPPIKEVVRWTREVPWRIGRLLQRHRWSRCVTCGRLCHSDITPGHQEPVIGRRLVRLECRRCVDSAGAGVS